MTKIPLVAFIGEPNVGKSTLMKRITGLSKIITADEPHTTRDLNFGEEWWDGYLIRFVDTGGLVPDPDDLILKQTQIKTWSAIAEADLLVWVMDVKKDPDTLDSKILQKIRKLCKPFIIAVNKVDDPNQDVNLADYARFGGLGLVNLSAHTGYGINDLLDLIVNWLKQNQFVKPDLPRLVAELEDETETKSKLKEVRPSLDGSYYIVRENTSAGPGLYSAVWMNQQYFNLENLVLDLDGVVFTDNDYLIVDWLNQKRSGLTIAWYKQVWHKLFNEQLHTQDSAIWSAELQQLNFWQNLLKVLDYDPNWASIVKDLFFQERTLRENVIELIQTQKQQGKRIFFLANVYDITWFESVYPQLMEIFDGGLASHWVSLYKPNLDLYKLFLRKYNLKPQTTLFVDDLAENLRDLSKLGCLGLWLESTNFDLEVELYNLENTPQPVNQIVNLVFDLNGVCFTKDSTGFVEIPATKKFLIRQKLLGKKIFYLTNSDQWLIEQLSQLDLWQWFDGGLASFEVGLTKDNPEFFAKLVTKYQLDPSQTVFIDDTRRNLEPALSQGLWTIWFNLEKSNLFQELAKIERGIVTRIPKIPKVLLLGKPNVGKSSLFNWLINKDLQIVTEIPGTTIGVYDYLLERPDGQKLILMDSTGIRKAGQRALGAETFATYKTIQAAHEADVLCLVVDGSQPLTHQDQVVAGICKEVQKGLVIIANKADLVDTTGRARFQKEFQLKFGFLKIDKFLWVSTKVGSNQTHPDSPNQIWSAVSVALENRSKLIDRKDLRTLFNYLMKKKPPQKLRLKKKAIIYDLVYTNTNPPTFELLVKDPETIHWSYLRFLENIIKKQFGFDATTIVVKLTQVKRKQVLS